MQQDFTEKVLKAYSNIEDPRLKFIVVVLIKPPARVRPRDEAD